MKSSDYTKEGVRIIQLQNIGDGYFSNSYKIFTSEEKAKSLSSNLIYPNEIIIAKMAAPLARAAIVPNESNKFLMASDGIRLKVDIKKYDNYFIFTLINSAQFRKEALVNSTGTTRKRIGLVTLGDLHLFIPRRQEQQKIGLVIKKIDSIIALQQDQLRLYKDLKQGLLQNVFPSNEEMVPKVRFSDFSGDWELRKFSSIVFRVSKTSNDSNIPRVEYDDVIPEQGTLKKSFYLKKSNKKGIEFQKNDILFGKLRPYLKNWIQSNFKGIAVGDWWVLRSSNNDSTYIYYLIQSQRFQNVANLSMGTKMPRSDWSLVSQTQFVIPTNVEQNIIGNFLEIIDSIIALQRQKIEKLILIKKYYLQKLFI